MNDYDDIITVIVAVGFFVLLMAILIVGSIEYERGYQQGQIDAINGSIHWQLERQENGEMLWIKCEDICANSTEDR